MCLFHFNSTPGGFLALALISLYKQLIIIEVLDANAMVELILKYKIIVFARSARAF